MDLAKVAVFSRVQLSPSAKGNSPSVLNRGFGQNSIVSTRVKKTGMWKDVKIKNILVISNYPMMQIYMAGKESLKIIILT